MLCSAGQAGQGRAGQGRAGQGKVLCSVWEEGCGLRVSEGRSEGIKKC